MRLQGRTRLSVMLVVVLTASALLSGVISNAFSAPSTIVAEIKARGKLITATDNDYQPYAFIEDGKLVGYTVDLVQYVAKDLGVKLETVQLPFAGILPGIIARKFDMTSAAIGMTEERASRFAFTVPISQTVFRVLKRKGDSRINALNDLAGKTVGVILNSAGERHLRAFEQRLKEQTSSGLKEIKLFRGDPEAFVALENGELDSVVASNLSLGVVVAKRPGIFEIVPGNVSVPSWVSWVVRPEDLDLLDSINRTLLRVQRLGVMSELKKKWFGFVVETTTKGYLPPGSVGREPAGQ